MDWDCPRDQLRVVWFDGLPVIRAFGFARPVPGVHPTRNLNGISFAVANVSGLLARAMVTARVRSIREAVAALERETVRWEKADEEPAAKPAPARAMR